VLIVLASAACSAPSPDDATRSSVTTSSASETTSDTTGFTNPVLDQNFADPQIVRDGDTWVAIATNGNTANVQTATSTDLVTWAPGDDALPTVASWSAEGKVWAPETIELAGTRVLYYTTRAPDPSIQCISVAVADRAAGPYADTSSKPLVCESTVGGSIDASPFVDADGKVYLLWKNDGNAVGAATWISVQELSPDGLTLRGRPKQLIREDQPWEGQLVEAPYLWRDTSTGKPIYHLFYSANSYADERYAVGHATAPSPLGPFTKSPEPVLRTNEVAIGPGHCALLETGDEVWMVYHAWDPSAVGDDSVGRKMWLSRVTFTEDGGVEVEPPTVLHSTRPAS
jgi:beta-xylosidase